MQLITWEQHRASYGVGHHYDSDSRIQRAIVEKEDTTIRTTLLFANGGFAVYEEPIADHPDNRPQV